MEAFITMNDFDTMTDIVEKINMPYIFYSIEDIKKDIEPDLKSCLPFAICLSRQPVNTQREKEARRYLLNVISSAII